MILIPSVWDASLAPTGHHAYTLEPFVDWQRNADYPQRNRDRSQPLYRALERVIADVRLRLR
jgi:phytoene dehydrogenase-like protein